MTRTRLVTQVYGLEERLAADATTPIGVPS
jgi:hypothetical protein